VAIDADPVVHALREAAEGAARVFIDIDCDAFDPAYFPGLADPMPFGLSPALLLRLIEAVWSDRVCGVALSEFDPGRDRNDQSLSTLVWLLEYLWLRGYE
jgi:agmatinase